MPARWAGQSSPYSSVGVEDDFGVGASSKSVPEALEPRPERLEVVDLPVLDGPDGSVLVGQRLVARLEIDDAQAADAEGHRLAQVRALVVRSAALQGPGHALH